MRLRLFICGLGHFTRTQISEAVLAKVLKIGNFQEIDISGMMDISPKYPLNVTDFLMFLCCKEP